MPAAGEVRAPPPRMPRRAAAAGRAGASVQPRPLPSLTMTAVAASSSAASPAPRASSVLASGNRTRQDFGFSKARTRRDLAAAGPMVRIRPCTRPAARPHNSRSRRWCRPPPRRRLLQAIPTCAGRGRSSGLIRVADGSRRAALLADGSRSSTKAWCARRAPHGISKIAIDKKIGPPLGGRAETGRRQRARGEPYAASAQDPGHRAVIADERVVASVPPQHLDGRALDHQRQFVPRAGAVCKTCEERRGWASRRWPPWARGCSRRR